MTKTKDEEKEEEEDEDKTEGAAASAASFYTSKPRCPSPPAVPKATGYGEGHGRPYSAPVICNSDFNKDMTDPPAVPPRHFKTLSNSVIGMSCLTEVPPDLKRHPCKEYSASNTFATDEEKQKRKSLNSSEECLDSASEAPPLPIRGPPVPGHNFIHRSSAFKEKRLSGEGSGVDSNHYPYSSNSPPHMKYSPPSSVAPPVPPHLDNKIRLSKRHSLQIMSDMKLKPNIIDSPKGSVIRCNIPPNVFAFDGGTKYLPSDRALNIGRKWNEMASRGKGSRARRPGISEDLWDAPPPVPPLPAHLQKQPPMPWENRLTCNEDQEFSCSSDEEEETTEPWNESNTEMKAVQSEEREQLQFMGNKVGRIMPESMDKHGDSLALENPLYEVVYKNESPPPVPPQRSESLYLPMGPHKECGPSPFSSPECSGLFQGAIPKKFRPTVPSRSIGKTPPQSTSERPEQNASINPADPMQDSGVNIRRSKTEGDGDARDSSNDDISGIKEKPMSEVPYIEQHKSEASENETGIDVLQNVALRSHEEDTGTVDSTNVQVRLVKPFIFSIQFFIFHRFLGPVHMHSRLSGKTEIDHLDSLFFFFDVTLHTSPLQIWVSLGLPWHLTFFLSFIRTLQRHQCLVECTAKHQTYKKATVADLCAFPECLVKLRPLSDVINLTWRFKAHK